MNMPKINSPRLDRIQSPRRPTQSPPVKAKQPKPLVSLRKGIKATNVPKNIRIG